MINGTDTATIYLVRHGRTELNASGHVRGRRADAPLDEVGHEQADTLSRQFAQFTVGAVRSSPLQRTMATAAAIARPHELDVTIDDAMLDRDWGKWSGEIEAHVVAEYGSLDRAPGVEPTDEFTERVVGRVDELGRSDLDGPLVLVTHDAVIKVVLAALSANMLDNPNLIKLHTGCWNQLERKGDTWTALVVDATPS